MKQLKKHKYKIYLFLFIISLLSSLLLSFGDLTTICKTGENCSVVQSSEYAYFLGVKNSNYGILIFGILSVAAALQIKAKSKQREKTINISIILGSIIALYFIYLQAFVIKAWCQYCLIVDISLLMALTILILTWKK